MQLLNLILVNIMQHDDGGPHLGTDEAFGYEDPNPHASLEDLCRSHLVSIYVSHSIPLFMVMLKPCAALYHFYWTLELTRTVSRFGVDITVVAYLI